MSRLAFLLALVPLAIVLLSGTVTRATAPQRGTDLIGPVYGEHRATQTIHQGSPRLTGIDVRIATYARNNDGIVTLRVHRSNPQEPLRTVSVPAWELRDNALHRFRFEPLEPSPAQGGVPNPLPLQVTLESSARDVGNAIAISAYPDEALWAQGFGVTPMPGLEFDGIPLQLQLEHALVYTEPAAGALVGTLGQLAASGPAPWLGMLAILVPGALVARICLSSAVGWVVVIAAAPAFGLALIAVLTLWAGVLGVRASAGLPIVVTVLAAFGLLAIEVIRRDDPRRVPGSMHRDHRWAGAAALVAVLIGLGFRAVAFEGLATPPGADSYHHTLITQLILDRGGVPSDYTPYAPISSYAYHFGFHAAAAWVGAVAGWEALQAVAMAGLLLNALAAFTVFGLVMLADLGPVTAAVAAVVVALVSPFPMWFLDVGRYPQEAALVLFPMAAALMLGYGQDWRKKVGAVNSASPGMTQRPIGRGSVNLGSIFSAALAHITEQWRPILGGAVLAAGLFLSHYRIALMLLLLVGLHLVWTLIRSQRTGGAMLSREVLRCGLILVGAAILVAPWIMRLMQGFTLGIRGSEGRYAADYYSPDRLGTALTHPGLVPLAVLAAIGIMLALLARAPLLGLLTVWGGVLFVGSNPHWLRFPGVGALDSVTVLSSLYMVAAIAVGVVGQRLWTNCPSHGRLGSLVRPGLLVVVGLLAGLGSLQLPALVRPEQVLAAEADTRAAAWIAATLPADARLLVNASIVGWEPDFVEPTDGGAWLPLLARRGTTLLPLVYAGERGATAADVDRMERIARAARADPAAPATLALLRESGVTHVYLGAYGGPIEEQKLAASPAYRRIYAADGVAIYELVGGAGA